MASSDTSAAVSLLSDQCLTFLLHNGTVRGRLVRLDRALAEILDRHAYPAPVARLVAETATLAVVLAFAMKFDGVFTLQAQGDGPVRMLVADVTSDGDLRAYASFDADAVAALEHRSSHQDARSGMSEASLQHLLGAGTLVFTVDLAGTMAGANNRYQGIVPMEDATLSECIHRYFRQSEQLETAVKVTTAPQAGSDTAWRAGAVMLQRMPRTPDEHRTDEELDELWRTAVVLLGSLTNAELLNPELADGELLYRLFHQEELTVASEQRGLHFGCRCSRERVETTLRNFAAEDRADMVQDDGTISVQCQFCSTEYVFTPAELGHLHS
ncbi:Hsp33 family molecular chaperone HslO [Insolitispirillum peregrinum]|uniref:Molecular chaperone Hsp33 n=1 Tax=Insolitispirillum peregrinum TaxID=80876 RepID=A0A1N7P321_9PROT|nr:Hsp33 family molecular chaperone HslO [Insolitispirillum peregrinum]SIT04993.1 molecular chaperone Hsp33 [Insolitispirillum peregrinum]